MYGGNTDVKEVRKHVGEKVRNVSQRKVTLVRSVHLRKKSEGLISLVFSKLKVLQTRS